MALFKRISSVSMTLLCAIICIQFFCTDIQPVDSGNNKTDAAITIFCRDGFNLVDSTGKKEFGFALTCPEFFNSIEISSSCEKYDTMLSVPDTDDPEDTVFVTLSFSHAGPCTLYAQASMIDDELKDRKAQIPVYVLLAADDDGTKLIPAFTDIPETIIAQKHDTILIAVDNSTSKNTQSIKLLDKVTVTKSFSILSTGSDTICLVSKYDAAAGTAKIGVCVSNKKRTDTTWYSVVIVSQPSPLWKTEKLSLKTVEGDTTELDLSKYLSDPKTVVTSDQGTISDDNIWKYTPQWGTDDSVTVKLIAKSGKTSKTLTLQITITPGDKISPELSLTDTTLLNDKRISAPEITIECNVFDTKSGIKSVNFEWNKQIITARKENDTTYSATIDSLEQGETTEVTIIATDKSINKNKSELTFTITYDSTVADEEAPVITFADDSEEEYRQQTEEGSFIFSVTDPSGIDSVWWTIDDDFGGAASLREDSTYEVSYTLSSYGKHTITLYAQDAAVNKNNGDKSISIIYNVHPSVPEIATPEAGAGDISTTPTLTWTGGEDEDGDSVFYKVMYRKSSEEEDIVTEEITTKKMKLSELEPGTEYTWRVMACSHEYPDTIVSDSATFTTEDAGFVITKQPSNPGAIVAGKSFTLTVENSETEEPITYQWYHNGNALEGQSDAAITIDEASKNDAGEYFVIVDNGTSDPINSTIITIVVKEAVLISTDPEPQQVKKGESASFTVAATGYAPLTYQWFKGNEPIADATRATFTIAAVAETDEGTYTCKVSNDFSSATSTGAELSTSEKTMHTVTFNTDGGSEIASQQIADGEKATKPEEEPGKEGYVFGGWFTSSETTAEFDFNTAITKPVTIYARWDKKQKGFTVTYSSDKSNQGTAPTDDKTYESNASVTVLPNSGGLYYGNASFNGWKSDDGKVYACGETFTITKSITLTASYHNAEVMDNDGNRYSVVEIGNQKWLSENLKTTTYNDGTPITIIKDYKSWPKDGTNPVCYAGAKKTNGVYYSHKVIQTGKLALAGWKIPSRADFKTLENTFAAKAPAELQVEGSSGFNAKIVGYISVEYGNTLVSVGDHCPFWTSTSEGEDEYIIFNIAIKIEDDTDATYSMPMPQENGCVIRLIKD